MAKAQQNALVTFPPTDIMSACGTFIRALKDECALIHAETAKAHKAAVATGGKAPKADPFPETVDARVNSKGKAGFRNPEQQADSLTKKSPRCFSAHMTNKARHILVSVNGGGFRTGLDKLDLSKANREHFRKAWVVAMKRAKLNNHLGVVAWGQGDEFHLQLPGAYKMSSLTRKLERRCLDAYLKITREGSRPKNSKFEQKQSNLDKLKKASKRTGIQL